MAGTKPKRSKRGREKRMRGFDRYFAEKKVPQLGLIQAVGRVMGESESSRWRVDSLLAARSDRWLGCYATNVQGPGGGPGDPAATSESLVAHGPGGGPGEPAATSESLVAHGPGGGPGDPAATSASLVAHGPGGGPGDPAATSVSLVAHGPGGGPGEPAATSVEWPLA